MVSLLSSFFGKNDVVQKSKMELYHIRANLGYQIVSATDALSYLLPVLTYGEIESRVSALPRAALVECYWPTKADVFFAVHFDNLRLLFRQADVANIDTTVNNLIGELYNIADIQHSPTDPPPPIMLVTDAKLTQQQLRVSLFCVDALHHVLQQKPKRN